MINHGHVTPNKDGSKARCGGPSMCGVCQQELAGLQQKKEQDMQQFTPAEIEIRRYWEARFDEERPNKKLPDVKLRDPFYEHTCSKCGHTGSSEMWFVACYGDDAGMICPICLNED